MKLRRTDVLALLFGALLPFAFAPFYYSVVAYISPAVLLYLWLNSKPAQAFRTGYLFGLSCFAVGISWVFVSIHVFGLAPISLSLLITASFIAYLSLYFGLQGYCLTRLFPDNSLLKLWLAFPCSFVFFEALRGWLFTGFPWLLLGYSQSNTWLRGYAPILGVYGISFLVAFIAGVLISLYTQKDKLINKVRNILILVLLLIAGRELAHYNWTQPIGGPRKATLIQGNIDQAVKWNPEQVTKTLSLYTQHTYDNLDSALIIWPEGAITSPLNYAVDFLNSLGDVAKKHNTTIITGIPIVDTAHSYNGMVAIGNGRGEYRKRHLVPFGEYTPLEPLWHFVVQAFNIPMSNCTKGEAKQPTLLANGIKVAPYICYEVAYPIEFLSFLPQAELLLTITDDSWFGDSLAPSQHLQMAQMRALETGRYLLFSSNTGITAVINAKGELLKSIPTFKEGVLTAIFQPMQGYTPWMILRTYPLLGLMIITVILGLRKRVKSINFYWIPLSRHKKRSHPDAMEPHN